MQEPITSSSPSPHASSVLQTNDFLDLLRADFLAFIERTFYVNKSGTPFIEGQYLELMAATLERCRRGEIKRLIINLPPRYLKSHCVSVALVAWWLGHEPHKEFICVSYAADLAEKLARDCRSIMEAPIYQSLFNTRLSRQRHAAVDFRTTAQGGRQATSVGGVLTGRGADVIIVDDPIKPEDALSLTVRNSVNAWFDSTLLSRLNNKKEGCIIVVMQRLHQDDLVGHILPQDNWTVLSLPALAEDEEAHPYVDSFGADVFRRAPGQPLNDAQETASMLQATRERIGTYNFSAQYQQRPIPEGGAIVKENWLLPYNALPQPAYAPCYAVQSWDTAAKSGELNDYSVCTTWMVCENRYYLIDVYRRRLNYPDLKRQVIERAERFRPNAVIIEDKSSGSPLIDELRGQISCKLVPYAPGQRDKVMRLHAVTDLFEAGQVWLPTQAPWLEDYRQELLGFPGSKFDDQVDSTTQALDYLRCNYSRNLAMWERLGQQ